MNDKTILVVDDEVDLLEWYNPFLIVLVLLIF